MQYDKGVQWESRTSSLHHSRARDRCAADIKQKGLNKAATLVGFSPSSLFFVFGTNGFGTVQSITFSQSIASRSGASYENRRATFPILSPPAARTFPPLA